MKRYPVIGEISEMNYPKGKCKICQQLKSDIRIDVETDCMRGNDEVFTVHRKCIIGKTDHEILFYLGMIELM